MSVLNLDIYTIIMLLFSGNILVLVILISYKGIKPAEHSYRRFFAGKMFQATAWLLLGLRNYIPDIVSIYIANTLLFSGVALESCALITVNQEKQNWSRIYIVFTLIGISVFWIIDGSPNMRVSIASSVTLLLFGTASVEMIRTSSGSMLQRTIGIMYGLFCFILLFRAGFAFFALREFTLMTRNPVQAFSFIALFFFMVAGGVGFLLMLKERDDRLLSEQEYKYRILVEKAGEAIVIVQDGMLVFANTRMNNLVGIQPGIRLEISIFDLIHPDDRELVITNYKRRISGDIFYGSYDFRLIRPGGEHIWVSVSSSKIQWKGKPAVLSLMTDITYRKNMEEEREKMISELQKALAEVKTLSGLLPICASCKKIRDDSGYWNQIEEYIKAHSEAEFSHSLCPDCVKKLYPDLYSKINQPDETG